jgi:hypothetical protein
MTVEATRISEDQFEATMLDSQLEYIDGRLLTRSAIEQFVGVREFEDFCTKVAKGEDG